MSQSSASTGFPERLRRVREERGLSQAQLADRTKLQPSAISHFETGRRAPSFDNLRVLADALNVSTDELLGRQPKVQNAGPVADRLYRRAANLTSRDLELLAEFADTLAKQKKPSGG